MADSEFRIEVKDLDMEFDSFVVQRNVNFTVKRGSIFIVMGGSGCGKSTLLKHMIGLEHPARGEVYYDGEGFWGATPERRMQMSRRFGVLFQSGALWSSMTLAENVALPLHEYTKLVCGRDRGAGGAQAGAGRAARLRGFLSVRDQRRHAQAGGSGARHGARPDILFFDEPSAGLDPISSKRLDDLILELRDSLGATVVVVTHELASIFAIGDDSIFLDAETRTPIAHGNPRRLLEESTRPESRHVPPARHRRGGTIRRRERGERCK